ncbi:hypothetical protein HDU97_006566 [Phlyctochytrium planicorne]|nr:hypothetical protein HDU97_006566 [Phlyctochytrium planicorne]
MATAVTAPPSATTAKSDIKNLISSLESLYDDLGLSPDEAVASPASRPTNMMLDPETAASAPAEHQPGTWNAFYSGYVNMIQTLQSKAQGPIQVVRPRKGSDPTGGRQRYNAKAESLARAIRGDISSPNIGPVRRPSWLENYSMLGSQSANPVRSPSYQLSSSSASASSASTALPSPQTTPKRRLSASNFFMNLAPNISAPRAPPPKAPLPPLPDGAQPPSKPRLLNIPELSAPPTFAKWRRRRGSKVNASSAGSVDQQDPQEVADSAAAAASAASEIGAVLTGPGPYMAPTNSSGRRSSLISTLRPLGQLRTNDVKP